MDGFSRDFWMGVVARVKGDLVAAQAAFTAARAQQEVAVTAAARASPIMRRRSLLGDDRRWTGAKRRGFARRPAGGRTRAHRKRLDGRSGVVSNLALIYAWTGERDLAIEQLEIVAKIPGGPTYGDTASGPGVGFSPRRSALRKNRQLPRAKIV